MNEFQKLLAYLKIAYHNLTTLHRNLVHDAGWFGNHEQLGDWYNQISDQLDDLTETALRLFRSAPPATVSLRGCTASTAGTFRRMCLFRGWARFVEKSRTRRRITPGTPKARNSEGLNAASDTQSGKPPLWKPLDWTPPTPEKK